MQSKNKPTCPSASDSVAKTTTKHFLVVQRRTVIHLHRATRGKTIQNMQNTLRAHCYLRAHTDASSCKLRFIFKAGLIAAQQRHAGCDQGDHFLIASPRRAGRSSPLRVSEQKPPVNRVCKVGVFSAHERLTGSDEQIELVCVPLMLWSRHVSTSRCRFSLTSHCSDHSAAEGKSQRDESRRHVHIPPRETQEILLSPSLCCVVPTSNTAAVCFFYLATLFHFRLITTILHFERKKMYTHSYMWQFKMTELQLKWKQLS